MSAGNSIRLAVSSWKGTSMAKIAPVAGVLKMAATPAAAPATISTFMSTASNQRRNRVCKAVPMAAPMYMEGPSKPMAPPIPNVAAAASTRPATGWRSSRRPGSWKLWMYSSEVAGLAPRATQRNEIAASVKPTSGAHTCTATGRSYNLSSMCWATTQSNPATASPVSAPVTAARSSCRWPRLDKPAS